MYHEGDLVVIARALSYELGQTAAFLYVPQGGAWLDGLTSPPMLALVAFGLAAGGGAAPTRRNRRRMGAALSRHSSTGTFNPVAGRAPGTAAAAAVAASAGEPGTPTAP